MAAPCFAVFRLCNQDTVFQGKLCKAFLLVKCSADAVGVAFVKVLKQGAYIIKQQFTCQFVAVVGSEELRSDPVLIVVNGGRPADCNKT